MNEKKRRFIETLVSRPASASDTAVKPARHQIGKQSKIAVTRGWGVRSSRVIVQVTSLYGIAWTVSCPRLGAI